MSSSRACSRFALALVCAMYNVAPLWANFDTSDSFVHLFEWRYQDIATECETWLGPLGFKGLQISPPEEAILGTAWWTRYQPVTYNLTSRSGSQEDLTDMVRRCAAVNVNVYADIVLNHMATPPAGGLAEGTAGSVYAARYFPAYQPTDFHHWNGSLSGNCAVDNSLDRYNAQYCDFNLLPDLATGSAYVQGRIASYISSLAALGVKGLRIDSAAFVPAVDVSAILNAVANGSDLLIYQEVIGSNAISPAEYTGIGAILEFDYPTQILKHFNESGGLQYLQALGPDWEMFPSNVSVVFVDNHDLQRATPVEVLTYKNGTLYELAVIFMLAFPYGMPQLMSSYYFGDFDQGPPSTPVYNSTAESAAQEFFVSYQNNSRAYGTGSAYLQSVISANIPVACGPDHPWVCEHRSPGISLMVRFRKATAGLPVSSWDNLLAGNLIAFSRGSVGFVAINKDGGAFSGYVNCTLPPGLYQNILAEDNSQGQLNVTESGDAYLELSSMAAVAYLTSN